jgi:hypothetical protein
LDNPDQLVKPVNQAPMGPLVTGGLQGTGVLLGKREIPDREVSKVLKDQMVSLVQMVEWGPMVKRVRREHLEPRVAMLSLVNKEPWVQSDQQALQVRLAPLDQQDLLDSRVTMD